MAREETGEDATRDELRHGRSSGGAPRVPTTDDEATLRSIRESVRALCAEFGEPYWRELDARRDYPTDFVRRLTEDGFLGCLIPEAYGGAGLGLVEAAAILEEIARAGGNPGAAHAQLYTMGSILRHGSDAQKARWLPPIARGELRLQSFGVTEPTTGTDTTSLKTFARRTESGWSVSGQKVWISRVEHSDLLLLLARTQPIAERQRRRDGLSVFVVELEHARANGLEVRPIDAMINHHACELFLDEVPLPEDALLGEEHRGFDVILDGMNAERILIAAECVGDARYFVERAVAYASEREVFGKPIGANQGIAFPLARAHADLEAAALMVDRAARRFDAGEPCGAEANMAKLLAADASRRAGDAAMQTFGGYGLAREYDIERKFRESRLYQVAPISTNLILAHLAEHALGLPRCV